MPAKLKYQDVYDYFKLLKHELLETVYINAKTKMKYKCRCGNITYATLSSMKNSIDHTCKQCASKRVADKNKLSFQEVYNYFESKKCHLLETEYKNNHTPMRYICECGNESVITFGSFQQGTRCNKHAIEDRKEKEKHSYEYVFNYFKEKSCKLLETEYINCATKMKYECKRGHISFTTFNNFLRYGCGKCADEDNSGSNNNKWNPNLTDEERKENESRQSDPRIKSWRKQVFKRDGYTCKICGSNKSNSLKAHHLDGYNWCIEKRYDVDNGITLDDACHLLFHSTFGYGNNTKSQFEEFLLSKNNQIQLQQDTG